MRPDKLPRPHRGAFFICSLVLAFWLASAQGLEAPPAAAIASAHPLATGAGHKILTDGGNAFDAAVAISAALAVVEPYSSGLGGGGFWLLHRARDGFEVMVDGRERAPLAADRDLYLNEAGEVIEGLSVNGPLAAGIPGMPAAVVHLAEHYGRLPLTQSLAPAIRLAEKGFRVDAHYREMAEFRLEVLRRSKAAARVFLADGEAPPLGYTIRQPALAQTLRRIAGQGHVGFYGGELARNLVRGVRDAGGIWALKDLASYEVVERKPIRGEYKGIEITSAAPPSSGGVLLVEMLNVLSGYDLELMDKAARIHVLAEAMRRAYRDRAEYLGDPDYVELPVEMLTDPMYAAGLRASVRLDRATPSRALPGIVEQESASPHTTHFSIIDGAGNRVAATLSINYPFGSGFMPPGTGVLLNDEMDDFAAKPNVPNVYGLVGAEANAIAPGKRMLSSMTPTFLDNGERVAVLGTPGGSRIITMVLLASLKFAQGASAEAIVRWPRLHHQYLPDVIEYEPDALNPEIVTALKHMGHKLRELDDDYGNMQVVIWDRDRDKVTAASDPRGAGNAMVR